MTPAELTALASAKFGYGWQTALAGALGVSVNAVQKWVAGQRAITDSRAKHIRLVCS